MDLLNRGRLSLESCGIFVMDEADRLIDMDFKEDLRHLLTCFRVCTMLRIVSVWSL